MKKYIPIVKVIGLLVILPVVIYCMSVSKSVRAWHEYRQLEQEFVPGQVRQPDRKAPEGEPLISTGAVLGIIMPVCDSAGVSVVSYSPEISERASGMELCSAELVLSGRFSPLMDVLENIACIRQIKTLSARFRCDERLRKEKRIQLEMEFLQLEHNNSDKTHNNGKH